jgi:hypothetical protein
MCRRISRAPKGSPQYRHALSTLLKFGLPAPRLAIWAAIWVGDIGLKQCGHFIAAGFFFGIL